MNIPSEWAVVRLKDIVLSTQPGFAQRPGEEEEKGAVPQIRTHNVSPEGQIDLTGIKYVTPRDEEFERYHLKPQDIIFNNTNSEEWVGKTALFEEKGTYVFSNHMTRIRTNQQFVEPEYLARYLHFLWQTGYSRQRSKRWVSQAAVDQSALLEFKIPLPTLPEQQRIVVILRQADELRQLRQDINDETSTLRRRLFNETFPNFDNPEKIILLGSICTFVTSRSRDWSRYYSTAEDDPKFIRVQNIKAGELDFSDIARVKPPSGPEADRARTQVGDLVISITGTIGQAAFVSQEAGECYVSQHVALVRTDSSIPPRFLVEYINHPSGGQQQINRMNYGQTKPGLNLTQIQNLRIPVFDSKQMNSFIAGLAEITILERTAKEKIQALDQVFQEVIVRAFSGEVSALWRAVHHRQLEIAARTRDAALGQANGKAIITEYTPTVRQELPQPERYWLTNHLGKVQGFVWEALREWPGTLIPSEDLDAFRQSAPRIEQIEDANDHILRALSQLAGLGLIAQVSVPNQQGEYVVGYRGLHEDERSHPGGLQSVLEPQR